MMDDAGMQKTTAELLIKKLSYGRSAFGRDHQARRLRDAFTRLCGSSCEEDKQSELVLLTGASGTGKTTLAEDLKHYVTGLEDRKGLFIAGKYDRLHSQQAPFSGLVSAFSDFAIQIVDEGEHARQSVRELVEANENIDRRLLVDVVPDLHTLFGEGSEETSLEGVTLSDTQKQRFRFAFTEFAKAITLFQPIVMFLDDLQWCDQDSLDLLEHLFSQTFRPGFMILGACRGNEVSVNDPLSGCLRSMESNGIVINEVKLTCFDETMVMELLSTMNLHEEETRQVCSLAFNITKGNLFYLKLVLTELCLENAIFYDHQQNRWQWNGQKAQLQEQTSSVDLVLRTMQRMPESGQAVLKTAACIGTVVSARMMRLLLPSTHVDQGIDLALKGSFLVNDKGVGMYRFSHDQIQEAAYSMIAANQRAAFHMKLLRVLWNVGVYWSYAVGQLIQCVSEITGGDEREKAGSLLLKAGRKASSSSAFGASLAYLELGIEILGQDRWDDYYGLCLALHNLASEVSYVRGDTVRLDSLANAVFVHAKSYEDKSPAYSMKILSLGSAQRLKEALKVGLEVLSHLGEDFRRPSKMGALIDAMRTKMALRKLSNNDVLNLPLMTDGKKLAAMRILNLLFVYAKICRPELVIPLTVRMVRLTLRHGLSAISACGFATFSIVLASGIPFVKDIDEAYALSKLSLRLLDKFERTKRQWLPRVYVASYGMVFPWKELVTDSFEPLLMAYRVGMRTGDVEYALMAAQMFTTYHLLWGTPLHTMEPKVASFRKVATYYKQDLVDVFLTQNQELIANLAGESDDIYAFSSENDETRTSRNFLPRQNMLLNKAWIALFMGDWDFGEETLLKLARPEAAFRSSLGRSAYYFLSAMFAVALLRRDGGRHGKRRYSSFKVNFRRIRELSRQCPNTFFPMQLLMEAEDAARSGRLDDAINKYTLTMKVASKVTTFHCEGLAAVRMGFTLNTACRNSADAREYFIKARTIFEAWGANVVVDRLTDLLAEMEPC